MSHTIALVDDDRNILTSISMALENEGFKVQTYIDAENALAGISRNPPDLAVIDIKMPRMDGEELLKRLRKKTSIPILFLTSKDEEVDELLGLKLGADDFIKKSGGFSIKVLIERIRVQLRKKNVNLDDTKNIIEILKKKFPNIKSSIKEDICYATTNRQEAVKKIARDCNMFFVIGSENSSNSKRLVEVAKKSGCKKSELFDFIFSNNFDKAIQYYYVS